MDRSRLPGRTPLALVAALLGISGCGNPNRVAKYPEGTLHVRYEPATSYSTCLVASVAMAGNYLFGEHRYSENGLLNDLRRAGRDETRVGDLKDHLAGDGLYLSVLSGHLGDEPPTGMGHWLKNRGYPVICVINRVSQDPAFNHAVVVIGISPNPKDGSTDIVYYLDPSAPEPLHAAAPAAFERLWARCEHAMMIVAEAPASRRDELRKEEK